VAFASLAAARGTLSHFVNMVSCSGPRRLVLLDNRQCSVGQTTFAASASWDDLLAVDWGGWLSSAGLHLCGTSSEDGASDYLSLLPV
jgi:hypothetical protein